MGNGLSNKEERIKLGQVQSGLDRCRKGVVKVQDNHLTSNLHAFYALKGIMEGKIIKFVVRRERYQRVWRLRTIRRLFVLDRTDRNATDKRFWR